jgi:hypothetical protein
MRDWQTIMAGIQDGNRYFQQERSDRINGIKKRRFQY